MKNIYLLLVGLLLVIGLKAQVVKTIENEAGKLDSLLTEEELNNITSLTVTGTMDARDFRTIGSHLYLMEQIDLREVTIVAYTDVQPTSETIHYEADVIPEGTFQGKSNLVSVWLPSATVKISDYAFRGCSALKDVHIPPTVTLIGNSAFADCGLTTISLPSSVTSLGAYVFWGCSRLTSINLPSSLTSIGNYAFYQCGELRDIVIPSSITAIAWGTFSYCFSITAISIPSSVTTIGGEAFNACTGLKSIEIPSSVTKIDVGTFSYCSQLSSVTLPSSITSIEGNAFASCSSLTSFTIPSSVTFIGSKAFARCTNLTSISFPSAITSMEDGVFKDCTSLATFTIPSSVVSIGSEAFSGCTALTSVDFPSSVTTIGSGAYSGCTSLTTISLPLSLQHIEESAFANCENLASLSIPSTVNYIGSYAFANCPKLTSVHAYSSVPVNSGDHYFDLLDQSKCTLLVPYGSDALYAAATEWKDFHIVADSAGFSTDVSFIKFDALGGEFQFTVSSTVAWKARTDQPWLKVSPESGSTGETLTATAEANRGTVNRYALITITAETGEPQTIKVTQQSDPEVVPVTADNLGYLLSKEEKSTMTSLTLTGTIDERDIATIVTEMPLLTKLDLKSTVITTLFGLPTNWLPGGSVDSYRIPGSEVCGGILHKPLLTSLELPSTLEVIGCGGLSGCSGLTSITIPPTVIKIGEDAFGGCSGLTSIIIPSSVIYIGKWAFQFCTSLKEVTIENGLQQLREGTFANCSSLLSITLPASIQSLERFVFGESSKLASIYSNNPQPPYADYSFYGVNKATCTVYVPFGSAAAYAEAEGWKDFAHIVETLPGFRLSTSTVTLKAEQGSMSTATIESNVSWTASSDQPWLTVSPSSGSNTQQLTFTANANPLPSGRTATVTISANGLSSQTITVIQETQGNVVHLVAGTLATIFSEEELKGMTNLTLSGTIDVRDFRTMRDKMPLLSTVDLRQTIITAWREREYYAANSVPAGAFYDKSSLTSMLLPVTVSVINSQAFALCTGLTTFKIPSTVSVIGGSVFSGCKNLDTLYCYASIPPELVDDYKVFFNVDKTACTLYIPHGSMESYEKAEEWKTFTRMVESLPLLLPSVNTIAVGANQGSMARVTITSDAAWTVRSDQPWLTVTPRSGSLSQQLVMTAEANPTGFGRMAVVRVSASDDATQTITVIQEGVPKSVHLSPGTLSDVLTAEELNGITHLTITGEMDLYDFKTLNDEMPLLTVLDLSGATIAAYSDPIKGEYGSVHSVPTYAFFNPSSHLGKSSLTSLLLPRSVRVIDWYAFSHCTGLTSIKIPPSVISLQSGIWNYCVNLDTVYLYAYPPVSDDVPSIFNHVKPTCMIYVPYGYKQFYSLAAGWKEMENIVEMPGFRLSASTVAVSREQASTGTVTIASNIAWTASVDQSWLRVNPAAGSGDKILTFTADANPLDVGRMATVTFSAPGTEPYTVSVIQEGKPLTVHLVAGALSTALTQEELKGITHLTITGDMDARDFKTMRDQMPLLTKVDLSNARIKFYSGLDGTVSQYNINYKEDEIPPDAFNRSSSPQQISSFTSIVLPQSLKSIEVAAFYDCTGLTKIKIPASVSYINLWAFNYCVNLDTLYSYAPGAPELYYSQEAFYNVHKDKVVLFVPYGSRILYQQMNQWKDFTNMVEMPGFSFSASTLTIGAAKGSTAVVTIDANTTWTAKSGQSWLKVSPTTGSGIQQLTFTALENPSDFGRAALVTFSAPDAESATVTVIQEGKPKTISLEAGTLFSKLTPDELNGITHLTITGEMDARDFKTMRDLMPLLSVVDLSAAKILSYTTAPGTSGEYYPGDAIPQYAFYHPMTRTGKSNLTSIRLPETLVGICYYAFDQCTGLTTFKIPATVRYLDHHALANCLHLNALYSYAPVPPQINYESDVFPNINKTVCTLSVPYGSKEAYAAAVHWKEFIHIVEMGSFELSDTTATVEATQGSMVTIELTCSSAWTAISDQAWLTVSPASGSGSQTLTFTAAVNPGGDQRMATVTVSAPGMKDQAIVISQEGLITEVAETEQKGPLMTFYPNPFTDHISIEINNPGQQQMTVDIYDLKGQRIKNLTIGNKAQKITFTWNAKDEKGQRLMPGIYLLKANGQTGKMVKR